MWPSTHLCYKCKGEYPTKNCSVFHSRSSTGNKQVVQEREPFQTREEVRDLRRSDETRLDDKEQGHRRAHRSQDREREREMTGKTVIRMDQVREWGVGMG